MERYRTTIIMAVALIVLVALAFFLTSKNASAPTGSTNAYDIQVHLAGH